MPIDCYVSRSLCQSIAMPDANWISQKRSIKMENKDNDTENEISSYRSRSPFLFRLTFLVPFFIIFFFSFHFSTTHSYIGLSTVTCACTCATGTATLMYFGTGAGAGHAEACHGSGQGCETTWGISETFSKNHFSSSFDDFTSTEFRYLAEYV